MIEHVLKSLAYFVSPKVPTVTEINSYEKLQRYPKEAMQMARYLGQDRFVSPVSAGMGLELVSMVRQVHK